MIIQNKLITKKGFIIRSISLDDCNEKYVNWLNDKEVNQYLETRWCEQNIESIKDFVRKQIASEDSYLFAICKQDGTHIGNIKIGPINNRYKHADISYFIGDKNMWNKGVATDVIERICKFGFEELDLHKIAAGAYKEAVGSIKALENNRFLREAIFKDEVRIDDKFTDVYRFALLNGNY
ncbi:Protein N-acetyltransferase, RimJ/RimL family [Pseudobutyrivibrio sp. AR14]|uniref:N-acetyltransferase n=1 Tax=Pseudobutyrivibrio ruminis TaxID=46206 RepID=A0A2G3ECZ3_9FIRM|nr:MULTISPECIES: GNAT family protein [Pseudobutyrivibrio]PHU40931.1 N-acetyltransferase [Pseudobutyrivibrio ruminis]SCY23809.1 Protein N-acetyltransferase, RimJ/RimL family [Pseudobutyrivibrio sp. AR14]